MSRGPLLQALREEHERHMVRQAELIRDWPVGAERIAAAETHLRLALFESGARISDASRYRVYSILSFAMPGAEPLAESQEVAFRQQLDRQTCPECGDGFCDRTPRE